MRRVPPKRPHYARQEDLYGRYHGQRTESNDFGEKAKPRVLRIEAENRGRSEQAELAIKVFELSQALEDKWLTADFAAKRQMLQMVFLNPKLDGVSLCYETNKPFDVLVKGLSVPSNRGDKTAIELFLAGVRGWESWFQKRLDGARPKAT